MPGIWTEVQTRAWKEVTSAVHKKGGLMSCQLLHAGRVAQPGIGDHPVVLQSTDFDSVPLPSVSSSATPLERNKDGSQGDYNWDQPAAVPRALATDEIRRVCKDYQQAAQNAMQAI